MSDSIFYCFGIPVASQRDSGDLERVELTAEDRDKIESQLPTGQLPR